MVLLTLTLAGMSTALCSPTVIYGFSDSPDIALAERLLEEVDLSIVYWNLSMPPPIDVEDAPVVLLLDVNVESHRGGVWSGVSTMLDAVRDGLVLVVGLNTLSLTGVRLRELSAYR